MIVTNTWGTEFDYDSAVHMMDADLREELYNKYDLDEQEFFSAYEQAHAEKFGEEWELSKANPCW